MTHDLLYRSSDNLIEVRRLVDPLTKLPITTATVEVTLRDKNGAAVVGQAWPLAMPHVPSEPGTYRATLPMELNLTLAAVYTAEITVVAGPTQRRTFRTPLVVRDSV